MIEINGIQYESAMKPKYSRDSDMAASILTIIASMHSGFRGFKKQERPNVDIVKEFELIELKKSNLSRSERDWVVKQFKSNFTQVI